MQSPIRKKKEFDLNMCLTRRLLKLRQQEARVRQRGNVISPGYSQVNNWKSRKGRGLPGVAPGETLLSPGGCNRFLFKTPFRGLKLGYSEDVGGCSGSRRRIHPPLLLAPTVVNFKQLRASSPTVKCESLLLSVSRRLSVVVSPPLHRQRGRKSTGKTRETAH